MEFFYEHKKLTYLGIRRYDQDYYTFRCEDGDEVWLYYRHDSWGISGHGPITPNGVVEKWFAAGDLEEKQKEANRFADYLFNHSRLRLLLLFR